MADRRPEERAGGALAATITFGTALAGCADIAGVDAYRVSGDTPPVDRGETVAAAFDPSRDCTNCVVEKCGDLLQTCANDPDCFELYRCRAECGSDPGCRQICAATWYASRRAQGKSVFLTDTVTPASCVGRVCADQCGSGRHFECEDNYVDGDGEPDASLKRTSAAGWGVARDLAIGEVAFSAAHEIEGVRCVRMLGSDLEPADAIKVRVHAAALTAITLLCEEAPNGG